MKRQILSILALSALIVSASAQSSAGYHALAVVNKEVLNEVKIEHSTVTVNADLTKSFEKKYPNAQDVQWISLDKGYSVFFVNNNSNSMAVFQSNGKFEYAITDVILEQLPPVLKHIVQNEFKESRMIKSVLINHKGNFMHQVILESSTRYTTIKAMGEDVEISSIQNATALK